MHKTGDLLMTKEELNQMLLSQDKYPSPLRYPGGKAKFTKLIKPHLEKINNRQGPTQPIYLVEPYAGGAGLGLSMLQQGVVDKLILNDLDKNIYAFWKVALEQPEILIDAIQTIDVTVKEHTKQKKALADSRYNMEKRAVATLFLNRTSMGGLISAGPIGGRDQTGTYPISARWNRERLVAQIQNIADNEPNITIKNEDGLEVLKWFEGMTPHALCSYFYFIDPPYVEKAPDLYGVWFHPSDHAALAEFLQTTKNPYVLCYDDTAGTKVKYKNQTIQEVSTTYNVNIAKNRTELIIHNL